MSHVAHTAATMRKKELYIYDKGWRNYLVELCKNKKVVDIYWSDPKKLDNISK